MNRVSLIQDTTEPAPDLQDLEALTHFLQWAREEARRLGLHRAAPHMDEAIDEISRTDGKM